MIEILHRYNGAVLHRVEADSLTRADLTDANLTGANLTRADLTDANLTRADLTGADGLLAVIDCLRLAGSRHAIWCLDEENVSIGCMRRTLAWWEEHHEGVGRAEGYTPAQIAEYGRHISYCREWLAARRSV